MDNHQMIVIPEPEQGTATVFIHKKKGNFAFIKGEGSNNYLCGACQNVLCEKVNRGQVVNIVFKCPNCGNFNILRGT
jgi:predicted RNA-binding Zn-ribbon protein involved in translation (DUF1610 family)